MDITSNKTEVFQEYIVKCYLKARSNPCRTGSFLYMIHVYIYEKEVLLKSKFLKYLQAV